MLLGTFSVYCTTCSAKSGRLAHIWPIGKSQLNSALPAQGGRGAVGWRLDLDTPSALLIPQVGKGHRPQSSPSKHMHPYFL